MERWLFLEKEPIEKIKSFSYDIRREFGKDYWNFSRFVYNKMARQSTPKRYSLNACFGQKGNLETAKLIIGQEFFRKPSIRFAFRYADIWADFILEYTFDRYVKTGELFTRNFNNTIEKYPHQKQI